MSTRHEDFAAVANVLAAAVREGTVRSPVAGRMLRHELRRMNTNAALTVPRELWSVRALEIDREWTERGEAIPKNGYREALHCDHVYGLREAAFASLATTQAWLLEAERLSKVVVVTAAENYKLQKAERAGADGPSKYTAAAVVMSNPDAVGRL